MKSKSLVAFIASLIGLTFTASAAEHQSFSFYKQGITNVVIEAAKTNVIGATNTYIRSGTTYTNAEAQTDVPLWANSDGTLPNASFLFSLVGTNAAFTNAVNVALVGVPRYRQGGTNALTDSTSAQVIALTPTGTTPMFIKTNLIGATFQGCSGVRLEVRLPTTGAGTNATSGIIRGAWVSGFVP